MGRKIKLVNESLEVVYPDGSRVRLDQNEAKVLFHLLRLSPAMVPAIKMAALAFGDVSRTGAVAVYVMRLRRKLGKGSIETVNGRGYRMVGG